MLEEAILAYRASSTLLLWSLVAFGGSNDVLVLVINQVTRRDLGTVTSNN